ncbi:hypothetical protein TIFTF001_056646 [Ficus carica]|uniref:Uncharacterized protein n=1 Tax=Ficus carica TaxID=3494 RepID=A0AA88JJN5_FICCA|nr:hypothetical protein TIFTF001_056646 [Ficus carica]
MLVINERLSFELILPVIKEYSIGVDQACDQECKFRVDHACHQGVHAILEMIMLVIKEVFTFGVDRTCDKGSGTLELIMLMIIEFSYGVDQLIIKICSLRVDYACDQGVFSSGVDHACDQVVSVALELIILVINEYFGFELIILVIKEGLALELIMLVMKKFNLGVDYAYDQ